MSSTTRALTVPLLVVAAACVGVTTPASAREIADRAATTGLSAYTVPVRALDGHCLAHYLADHRARVLGPVAV
jgi:hypothetical protein